MLVFFLKKNNFYIHCKKFLSNDTANKKFIFIDLPLLDTIFNQNVFMSDFVGFYEQIE